VYYLVLQGQDNVDDELAHTMSLLWLDTSNRRLITALLLDMSGGVRDAIVDKIINQKKDTIAMNVTRKCSGMILKVMH